MYKRKIEQQIHLTTSRESPIHFHFFHLFCCTMLVLFVVLQ